jgi:hypothetical protein
MAEAAGRNAATEFINRRFGEQWNNGSIYERWIDQIGWVQLSKHCGIAPNLSAPQRTLPPTLLISFPVSDVSKPLRPIFKNALCAVFWVLVRVPSGEVR